MRFKSFGFGAHFIFKKFFGQVVTFFCLIRLLNSVVSVQLMFFEQAYLLSAF